MDRSGQPPAVSQPRPTPWRLRSRLALAGLALACSGCAGTSADPTLVVAVPTLAGSLLPNAARNRVSVSIQANVYEALVDLDPNLTLRPGLAEAWHTPGELSWVFQLRSGVKLHDGSTLSAEHVVASLEFARSDARSCRRAQLADVESVAAISPLTVEVRTRRPIDTLAARLSNVFVAAPPARSGEPAAGSGPYRIRSQGPGEVVLESFPEYREGAPLVRLARFESVLDEDERIRRLRDGRADLLPDLSVARAAEVAASPRARLLAREDSLQVLFLAFDCRRSRTPDVAAAANPFRDVRVRQAVALAVDRRALVEEALAGRAEPVDQIAPQEELGAHRRSLVSRPHDPSGARRLLAAAGYGAGFRAQLDFADAPDRRAVAQALARDLARLGIRLEPRGQSPPELARRLEARQTSLYLETWTSETGDGRLAYEYLLHSPSEGAGQGNAGAYSSPEMDRLIRRATGLVPRYERQLLLARLAAKVAIDVPLVPLSARGDLYGVAEGLSFEPRLDRQLRLAAVRRGM